MDGERRARRTWRLVLGAALLGAALLLLTACGGSSGGGSSSNGSSESVSTGSASAESDGSESASAERASAESASAEDDAREAAEAYYAAAASGDYNYTYQALSSFTRGELTEDEWVAANTDLGSDEASYSVTSVNMADESTAEVNLTVNQPDGSSSERFTRFVLEDGGWKHDLTQEEYDLFASATDTTASASAAASASASAAGTSGEDDAREAAEAYYAAAASGDYNYTYQALSSFTRGELTEDEWVAANTELGSDAASYSINSVELVDDTFAEVALTVNLPDGSSSERLTWFILEDGGWKHDLTQEEYDLFASATDTTASASAAASASASAASGDMASAEQKVVQDADTVDDLLNEFWTQELQAQYGLVFDPPDRYAYYRGAANPTCAGEYFPGQQNAYYCSEDTDEYVAFDLDLFTSYLPEHPGGATTFSILAHEWGHSVQDTWVEQQPGADVWNPSYLKELNADCLAGVWMEDALRRGTVIEESGDAEAIFESLWEGGSGAWFAPGDHGTSEQRQLAFSEGFEYGTDYCRTNY